jgi:diaminohydroxyphosphoribosylaminopyrimidine deaminase/5-amino-6-(5-phosphoribosylamino)uracil reductase
MPEAITPLDERFAAASVRLGAGALGSTWPNPAVGAIVVQDGLVLGRGRTAPGGRPHGEAVALAAAGHGACGATLYVSLEPCAHRGRTPPCSDAVIAAGVGRVVATVSDPDARVAGRGFAGLRAAGVPVATGACESGARRAHAGHILRTTSGRPFVCLKLAVSADGAIGRSGEGAVAVTGEIARRHVQALRARFDAILVGRGTVEADDPRLTCRLPGLERRSPVRVVLDTAARLTKRAKIFDRCEPTPTWVVSATADRQGLADGQRVRWLRVPDEGGRVDLGRALAALAEAGITRLLVEGGAAVAGAFLAAGLVDEAILFHSPVAVGEGRVPALGATPLEAVTASAQFRLVERRRFGGDRMARYERAG